MATTVSRENAARFLRSVEPDEMLNGIKMIPMAGNTLMTMGSLEAAEAFLRPVSPEEAAGMRMNIRIFYVKPEVLSSWVRDTIGDVELASGLDEIIATGHAYGVLVPDMKRLIADRIAECRAVLEDQLQESHR